MRALLAFAGHNQRAFIVTDSRRHSATEPGYPRFVLSYRLLLGPKPYRFPSPGMELSIHFADSTLQRSYHDLMMQILRFFRISFEVQKEMPNVSHDHPILQIKLTGRIHLSIPPRRLFIRIRNIRRKHMTTRT